MSGGQSNTSRAKNNAFFKEHRLAYDKDVQELDTYAAMRRSLDETLRGFGRLLDVGNGRIVNMNDLRRRGPLPWRGGPVRT